MRRVLGIGLLLIAAGFVLVLLGSAYQSGLSTGGFLFIGPFPIVFGTGRYGSELALISVVIGGVMLASMLLWGWRISRQGP